MPFAYGVTREQVLEFAASLEQGIWSAEDLFEESLDRANAWSWRDRSPRSSTRGAPGESVEWLQTIVSKKEPGHCLRLPQEGPCECDLYLNCASS